MIQKIVVSLVLITIWFVLVGCAPTLVMWCIHQVTFIGLAWAIILSPVLTLVLCTSAIMTPILLLAGDKVRAGLVGIPWILIGFGTLLVVGFLCVPLLCIAILVQK